MDLTSIIGLLAATGTTISFVPQVVRIVRTRDTKGISLVMYIVFTAGISLWLVYGVLLNELPIIIANAATLVLALTILGFKIKHG